LKILHAIYDDVQNPWCGGGGAYRTLKVNESIARKNPVTVLTGNFPGARNQTLNGVSCIRVGNPSSYLISRITFTLFVPFYLRSLDCDIVIVDCSFFAPCFANLYVKKPVVDIIHHIMGDHSFKLHSWLGVFPSIAEKVFLKLSEHALTSSEAVKQSLEACTTAKHIENIPNGVSQELFQLIPEEQNFILFLGRIDLYMKGLDLLIEAFSRIRNRDVKLKIAGSGKRGDIVKLNNMIRQMGLENRVEYLGKVDREEKFELFRTCLFLVMPSRFEGWGITAVEANAAGKAVLGTNIPGLSEAVIHDKTALLIEPNNVKQLTASLDLLLDHKEMRGELGRQGRTWARQFSWESICDRQYEFYRTVLHNMQVLVR